MGVWIETETRNLKYEDINVTPFVGVWIETLVLSKCYSSTFVTPFVGVWIETLKEEFKQLSDKESHPSWVCGLKHNTPFWL